MGDEYVFYMYGCDHQIDPNEHVNRAIPFEIGFSEVSRSHRIKDTWTFSARVVKSPLAMKGASSFSYAHVN